MNIAIQDAPKLTDHPWRKEIVLALSESFYYYVHGVLYPDDFSKIEVIRRYGPEIEHHIWNILDTITIPGCRLWSAPPMWM